MQASTYIEGVTGQLQLSYYHIVLQHKIFNDGGKQGKLTGLLAIIYDSCASTGVVVIFRLGHEAAQFDPRWLQQQ